MLSRPYIMDQINPADNGATLTVCWIAAALFIAVADSNGSAH